MGSRISVTGTLTKIDWINPHIVLAMDARGDGGKTEHWTFQSNPPSWYRSVGLARADFAKAIGQTVTVEGVRARDLYAFWLHAENRAARRHVVGVDQQRGSKVAE